MPTRFRKTITIFPGVRANISKGGVSFSVGRKGFTINVGKHGVRRTVSLPGTGVSNTEYISKKDGDDEEKDKGKQEGGLLEGAAPILMGMAAGDILDGDDDDHEKSRGRKRKKTNPKSRKSRSEKKDDDDTAGNNGYALRGIMVFAAIAIGVYLGSQVLPQLPPTWPQDLVSMILQWAVQFGH